MAKHINSCWSLKTTNTGEALFVQGSFCTFILHHRGTWFTSLKIVLRGRTVQAVWLLISNPLVPLVSVASSLSIRNIPPSSQSRSSAAPLRIWEESRGQEKVIREHWTFSAWHLVDLIKSTQHPHTQRRIALEEGTIVLCPAHALNTYRNQEIFLYI